MRTRLLCMRYYFLLAVVVVSTACYAQTSQMEITLVTTLGDPHKNIRVTLKDMSTGKVQTGLTSRSGIVSFYVEGDREYEIKPDNYYETFTEHVGTDKVLVRRLEYTYNASPTNPELKYKFTPPMMAELAKVTSALKDTSAVKPPDKGQEVFYAHLRVKIGYLGKPLVGEKLFFTLNRQKKTLVTYTDAAGKCDVYLPKGDTIQLHFTHDRNYRSFYYYPSLMERITDLEMDYMGTKEIERLAKAREERMKKEKERLEKERLAFEAELKREHLSRKDGIKKAFGEPAKNKLFTSVFSRNKWGRKLVVVDVTGSMAPYVGELLVWLKLNFEKEKGIQFVFFNDGDDKSDELKRPGKTGGVYYIKPKTYTELVDFAAVVAAKGSGGDTPENNCEALLKALHSAKDYDEVVMVADSRAGINDMELVGNITKPVRIILCGIEEHGFVEPDYLVLGWKTKGSIHSIEKDIDTVAKMMEGKMINVFGSDYRLQNGRFIPVSKL